MLMKDVLKLVNSFSAVCFCFFFQCIIVITKLPCTYVYLHKEPKINITFTDA